MNDFKLTIKNLIEIISVPKDIRNIELEIYENIIVMVGMQIYFWEKMPVFWL